LVNVCAGIVFVPLVVTPVMPAGCVAVQLNVTLVAALVKLTTTDVSPEHKVCGDGENKTVGDGFTVTISVKELPVQVPVFGLIV
jgi:hypothetical protein